LQQPHLPEDRDRVRIDVLALDLAVRERDHVHALPFDLLAGRLGHYRAAAQRLAVRGGGGPLLDDEVLADVEPARLETDVGPGLEDLRYVSERLLALGAFAGGVVLEHHVGGVHRTNPVDVVRVPGVVVRGDRLVELLYSGHAHSIGSNPLLRGADTIRTLAGSDPLLRTVRVCSGSR